MDERPIKVAIVGGGCAAMAAAFELTRPHHHGRYAVTVYQVGWRLGGKGASGRGVAGRIEEHGLHLWMGFYENAFRLMRECYAELARQPGSCPIVDWQDAFKPATGAGLADRRPQGDWTIWTALLPPGGGLPGDPGRKMQHWTVADYVLRSVGLIGAVLEHIAARQGPTGARPAPAGVTGVSPDTLLERLMRSMQHLGPMASLTTIIESFRLFHTVLAAIPGLPAERIAAFFQPLENAARQQLHDLVHADDELRRVWEIVDMLLAVVRGSLRHGLLLDPRGFDAIDDYDCREWLRMHGASEGSVNGAFVRGLHDLALAYEQGEPGRMRFGAGQGLRGAFRAFLNYRGSFFWKMQAGMGDVVFAPFYEVLSRRGVKFEFFHRLRNVGLNRVSRKTTSEPPHVATLRFDVQAATVTRGRYEPLVPVHGLPCWPAEPDWSQLADGARLQKAGINFESHWETHKTGVRTLKVGRDFDLVVLAIGLGAVPDTCRELIACSPRWRDLVERVATVPTQAFQIWLKQDSVELGWRGPELSSLSAFADPFGTWADMSHLIDREDWPDRPRSIAYFCGVLPERDAHTLISAKRTVHDAAVTFLNTEIGHLWPKATAGSGRFRWDLLVEPDLGRAARSTRRGAGRAGADSSGKDAADERRFDTQFWTANVNPSDRYVQSFPGTSPFRLSPLEQQFDNLTVAGDWTDTGLNIGCVEAAVMSGRLAAHALSRSPVLEEIVGFDHP